MLSSGSFGRPVSVLSCLAIISLKKRRLVVLFCCLVAVSVLCLFLTAPCDGLQCVIVVFLVTLTYFFLWTQDLAIGII